VTDGSPDIATAVKAMARSEVARVRVSVTARVVAWDASTPFRADVEPLIPDRRRVGTTTEAKPVGVIRQVPVRWPGLGTARIVGRLAVGDLVELVVRDRSHDEVNDGDTEPLTPRDLRRFDYSDAYVAFAATAPDDAAPSRFVAPNDADVVAWAPTGGKVYLGGYKAAAEALALAQLVKHELDKIQDEFNGHVHGIPPLTSPSGPVTAVGSGANFAAVSGPVDNVAPWVVPRSYTASPVASNRVFSDEEG